MAGRSTRDSLITAALEGTSGVDATPSHTTDAVLYYAQGLECSVKGLFVDRDVIRGGMGAPDKLLYARRGSIGYSVDLAGSGAAGTAPAWGRQLQAAGMAETISAGNRVEYTPVSASLKTLTHWAYWAGVRRKFVYCSANSAKVRLKAGEPPMLDLGYSSLVQDLPDASANPTPTLTAWKRPLAVGPLGTAKIRLGGTYSAGVVSGGTEYDFSEFSLDLAPSVQDVPLVTAEAIDIDNRNPSASVILQLNASQEAAMHALMGSSISVGVSHGTTAGNKLVVWCTSGVVTAVEDAPQGNKLLTRVDFSLPPIAVAGDEFRIVSL